MGTRTVARAEKVGEKGRPGGGPEASKRGSERRAGRPKRRPSSPLPPVRPEVQAWDCNDEPGMARNGSRASARKKPAGRPAQRPSDPLFFKRVRGVAITKKPQQPKRKQ